MGLTINFLSLLTATKKRDIPFGDIGVLGKQFLYTDFYELKKLFGSEQSKALLESHKGYADGFYKDILHAKNISVFDISGYEGADIIHDFGTPLPAEWHHRFDIFLESGSLEHVFDFPTAIRNCMMTVKQGGRFIGFIPANNFCGHGFYQFSPEVFFRIFSEENGFAIEEFVLFAEAPFSTKYDLKDPAVLKRRMDFCNSQPLYMYIVAKRINNNPPFAKSPYQSDYVTAWENGSSNAPKKMVIKSPFLNYLRDMFNKHIRRGWKAFIRNCKRKTKNLGDLSAIFYSRRNRTGRS